MEFRKNQILYTKDGRVIGNAIITDIVSRITVRIKTDYGNSLEMSIEEVKDKYYTEKFDNDFDRKMSEINHKYAVYG